MSFVKTREFERVACYSNLTTNIVVRFSNELWGEIDAMQRPMILNSFKVILVALWMMSITTDSAKGQTLKYSKRLGLKKSL